MNWTLSAFADEAAPDIDSQIAALRRAGLRHIDLRNVDGINICELPLDHAAAVEKKLAAAGVAVCMYGSPIGKIDLADDFDIDLRRLRHLGELKKIFRARAVRLFSYYNRKAQLPRPQFQQQALDRLRRLTELAADLDLVLYHEHEIDIFGYRLEDVLILRDQLHRAAPDRFKLIFDFDNFNQAGHDIWPTWLALRDDVEALHLKESQRQPDGSYMHVPAGEGDGQIPRVLADLAERGWNGPLTLEPHLARTAAVLATGPHGQANARLAGLSPADAFQLAADTAKKLLAGVHRL